MKQQKKLASDPQPEKNVHTTLTFSSWKFCWGRGKRDLAICLRFLGSKQPSQSNPLQQAAFSLEVWTNGHCMWDWL